MTTTPDLSIPEQSARAAAKWWADFLRSGRLSYNNGDDSASGGMAFAMMAIAESRKPDPVKDGVDAFEHHLSMILLERLSRPGRDASWPVSFGVDYGPDPELRDALVAAGIPGSSSRLPWKTTMWAYMDHVDVSTGYGREAATIFDAREGSQQEGGPK